MKSKDLWDMRDINLPSNTSGRETGRTDSRQEVKSRQSTSLAEWGEKTDFWNEWESEFKDPSQTESFRSPQKTLPTLSSQDMSSAAPLNSATSHEEDPELHLEPWASQLAFHERRLEKEGTVDYGLPFKRQEMLGEKTKEFGRLLQSTFRKQIEIFNQSRKSPAHAIHIYRISRSDEDFLIYRNGIKLIISSQRAGRITLSFNQYLAPNSQSESLGHVELEAIWGPFDQLYWSYKGERVQLMDIVRYFLSELAFQSFR
jgi:hypothetical protein